MGSYARARGIDDAVKLAAARAIAMMVPPEDLGPERILPSALDRRVVRAVARAVAEQAAGHGGS